MPESKTKSSQPPPPPGSNLRYALLGLLFLAAAAGLWLFAGDASAPPPPPPPPPPAPERVNPMAEPELELEPEPEPEPEPDPEPEAKKPAKKGSARGDWECGGDLPGVAKLVDSKRSEVRACYERRLKVNNILAGNLQLQIKVDATGKVAATRVSGSLRDNEVFSCVRKKASSWTFPEPVGDRCAVLQVPFAFTPKD